MWLERDGLIPGRILMRIRAPNVEAIKNSQRKAQSINRHDRAKPLVHVRVRDVKGSRLTHGAKIRHGRKIIAIGHHTGAINRLAFAVTT
jgi:hypothetical protein